MMKHRMLLLLAAGLLLAAQDPNDPNKKGVKLLEGTWTVMSLESEGKKVPDKDLKDMKMIFQGDKLTIKKGSKILGQGTFKINLAQKPLVIDYKEGKDITSPYDAGIFEIAGDTMKYCTTADPKKRPSGFDSKQGWLFVLKKDKTG